MNSRKVFTLLGFIGLAALSFVVFAKVMAIRFASGEMYPHYSSQRTDPLGSQALFDSLERIDSVSVSRNFTALTQIPSFDGNTALFLIGIPRQSVGEMRAKPDSPVLKSVRENGARLVLTIDPSNVIEAFQPTKTKEEEKRIEERRKTIRERLAKREKEKEKETADNKPEHRSEPSDGPNGNSANGDDSENQDTGDRIYADDDEWKKFIGFDDDEFEAETRKLFGAPLLEQWKLGFTTSDIDDRPEAGWEVEQGPENKALNAPEIFPNWQSPHRFKRPSGGRWKTIARIDGEPVVLEQKLGKGTVVIASDSFFASNEALHLGGSPEFLLWLAGGKTNVIFDETIHGSSISIGSAKLIKKYRLHGFFIGMFIFVLLWAWRSSSSLAPASDEIDIGVRSGGEAISGEESGSGFVQLLRRSISPKELIEKCVAVWRESSRKTLPPKDKQLFEQAVQANESDPKKNDAVSTYHRLAELLKRRI